MSNSTSVLTLRSGVDRGQSGQWRALRLFMIYRVLLGGVLLLIYHYFPSFGMIHPQSIDLYQHITFLYMCVHGMMYVSTLSQRYELEQYANVNTFVDILLFTGILYTCGGLASGLGILLNISIVGAGLLASGSSSLLFAAIAFFMVFSEESLLYATMVRDSINFFYIGIYGLGFYATALLAYLFSQKVAESELLVEQSSQDIQKLETLNELVIEKVSQGVIVCDMSGDVMIMNQSTRNILEVETENEITQIRELPEMISASFELWQKTASRKDQSKTIDYNGRPLSLDFKVLGNHSKGYMVIFINDLLAVQQEAQSMKLASLGKFTASIAHELRNPLGAISHAGQLLKESELSSPENSRLVDIVCNQSERMNKVIKNILRLTTNKGVKPIQIHIVRWMQNFIKEYRQLSNDECYITLNCPSPSLEIRFNEEALHQVFTNLFDNGLRYSKESSGDATLKVSITHNETAKQINIEVSDEGTGIPECQLEQVFEPFYTTSRDGTGLGLYICKTLCEANHAELKVKSKLLFGTSFMMIINY